MYEKIPDFYLASNESNTLRICRKCYIIKRFHALHRDDYLLIRVSPPLEIQVGGALTNQVEELIIATRHQGETLFPITKWPIAVYVLRSLVEIHQKRDVLKDDELGFIGWAEISNS